MDGTRLMSPFQWHPAAETVWPKGYLPAEFRADRASRAGDQHHLAFDALREQPRDRRHGVPPDEVLDADLLDVAHFRASFDQRRKVWNGADSDSEILQLIENRLLVYLWGRRDGKQYLGDPQLANAQGSRDE